MMMEKKLSNPNIDQMKIYNEKKSKIIFGEFDMIGRIIS